jgi:hypothetical protein
MVALDYKKIQEFWNQAKPSSLSPYMIEGYGFPESASKYRFKAESKILKRLLEPADRNGTVLDLGGGVGLWTSFFAERFRHVIAVGTYFGGALTVISLIAAFSIVLRTAARIDPNSISDQGTQTNELLRHIMFILLIGEMTGLNLVPILTTIFLMNSISMLLPTRFPFMLVHYAKTPVSMMWFNISLILAYWFQPLTYLIGAAFFITYIYSFSKALIDVGIKEWAHTYG